MAIYTATPRSIEFNIHLKRCLLNVRYLMHKNAAIALKTIGALVGILLLVFMYEISTVGALFDTIDITNGKVGDLVIGETKEEIFVRLSNQSFSPRPKPTECPANWIKVSEMTSTQKNCLITTDIWQEGVSSTAYLCKQRADVNTILHFLGNKLERVTTECWHPL